MTRIAIIAAMPGELNPLVRGWNHENRNGVDIWRWRFDEGEWIAACAGAGIAAATRAFAEIERNELADAAISTGWAGALSESAVPGRAYTVSGVIDAQTGERFGASPLESGGGTDTWLVTSAKVADCPEKQRLSAAYKACLVDMEAAAIARLAQMRSIPFHCVKGVSDGFGEALPDLNRFIASDGKFRLAGFLLFVLVRPWYWPALVRMGENSKKAAYAIAESLLNILDIRGEIRERNGYPGIKR